MGTDQHFFAVWEGWGGLHPGAHSLHAFRGEGTEEVPTDFVPAEWQLDLSAPTFSLPGRTYLLFAGPVHEATRTGHWVTADWFDPQSPSIFWPADHAWCVSTEIDYDSTLVGGTSELIAEILNAPGLEAWPIDPDAPRTDVLNDPP